MVRGVALYLIEKFSGTGRKRDIGEMPAKGRLESMKTYSENP